jgi:hypothetical protein
MATCRGGLLGCLKNEVSEVKNRDLPRPFDTLAKGISSSESEDMLGLRGNGVKC